MTFLTIAQLMQLGKKCSLCDKNATWLCKFNKEAPVYCDEHYPYISVDLPFEPLPDSEDRWKGLIDGLKKASEND